MKTLFLVSSVVLTLVSAVPYMRDILRGTTKPNLVSWITWSLLTGVATAAAISAHEYVAAIFTGAATLETSVIVLLGLRHGYVKYTQFDLWCQVGAVVGIVLWQIFNSPSIGVVAAVAIDFIGALPTFRHSWLNPEEETWTTFAIASLGGAFAIGALSTFNWVTLPYAVYLVVANAALYIVIIGRKQMKVRAEKSA
jgi:hypothetical protein